MPRGTLRRAAVAATVMCDNTVTFREEVEHLVVPVISTQRPSMVEDNCLGVAGTPVLVEDAGTIRRSHGTHCHFSSSFRCHLRSLRSQQRWRLRSVEPSSAMSGAV